MFARQLIEQKAVAAIGADAAVAGKELGVGQGRCLAPGPSRDRTPHRDDGVHMDSGLQAGQALCAASQDVKRVTQRPRHSVAGVEDGRVARRNPSLGPAGNVKLQNVHGRSVTNTG